MIRTPSLANAVRLPHAAVSRPWLRPAAAAGAMVLVAWLYLWVSTGAGARFLADSPYHSMLAQAFQAQQLHLLAEPPPELLALPDPYDGAANQPYRSLHDVSLYNGHYYLYWGPLPALLRLPGLLLAGWLPDDVWWHVAAALLAVIAFGLLLQRTTRLAAVPGSTPVAIWATAMFALGGLMFYLVGRPSVYHEPLLHGMAACLWSWYALLRALTDDRRRTMWWLLSAVLLGAAVAARALLVTCTVAPAVLLAWQVYRARRGAWPAPARALVVFTVPLAVTALLLGLYNWARFGTPTEFGLTYQLRAATPFYRSPLEGSETLTLQTMPVALQLYLFPLTMVEGHYPFIPWAHGHFDAAGASLVWPDLGGAKEGWQAATQIYLELPLLPLGVLAPSVLGMLCWPWLVAGARPRLPDRVRALVAVVGAGGLLTLLVTSAFPAVTLRYQADFLPALAFAGAVGLVWLVGRLHCATARWRSAAIAALVTTGAAASLLTLAVSFVLAVGIWQYELEDRAADARQALDAGIARLAALAPGAVGDWIAPNGRTTWRRRDGLNYAAAPFYLRAPAAEPSLVVDLEAEQTTTTTLGLLVDGVTVLAQRVEPGRQVLVTDPLPTLGTGSLARVQLTQLDPPVRAGEIVTVRVLQAGLAGDAAAAPYRQRAALPALLVRGVTDDGWVLGAGLDLVLGPDAARRVSAVTLGGDSNVGALPAPLTVTGSSRGADGAALPVPVSVSATDARYAVRVDLSALSPPADDGLVVHLAFAPGVVPAASGASADPRPLVVRGPREISLQLRE